MSFTWPKNRKDMIETLLTGLLSLLFLPVIIGVFVFIYVPFFLISFIRRDPRIRINPILGSDTVDNEKLAKLYVERALELIPEAKVTEDLSEGFSATLHTSHPGSRDVTIYHTFSTGIFIDGADTGFWHIDEQTSLDLYFWVAVAALKGGVRTRRSIFGRKQVWIPLREYGAWYVLGVEGATSGTEDFRRTPKGWQMPGSDDSDE